MRTVQLCAARAVAFLLLIACSTEAPSPPVNLGGNWIGTTSDGTTRHQSFLLLTQNGQDVAGTLDGMALLGTVDANGVSFTLTSGTGCGMSARGSGTVATLPDRERLSLSWFGASCGGALSGSANLDRMRCVSKMACTDATGHPFCADVMSDGSNCGQCGFRCGDYQVCQAGTCTVPVCTGPVPLQSLRAVPADPGGPTLALGDVNGDGATDLVIAGTSAAPADRRIGVLLGDGHGNFGAPVVTRLPVVVLGFALGDVDGDGVPDVVLVGGADYDAPSVLQVLHGVGDGTFGVAAAAPAGPWLAAAPQHLVALADLDGDGTLDVVIPGPEPRSMVGSAPDPTIEVRRGTGHGTFGDAETYPVAAHLGAVAVADLDQDGHPDVVAVGWGRGRVVSVLFNHGDGTLMAPVDLPAVDQPMDVMVSDVDGDGLPDIVVAGGSYTSSGERVAIHRGQGNRSFAPPLKLVQDGWDFDQWIAIADLNGDGHPDLVVAVPGAFLVFPGKANATFGSAVRFPVQTGAVSIEAADLDADGTPELVMAGTATMVAHACIR